MQPGGLCWTSQALRSSTRTARSCLPIAGSSTRRWVYLFAHLAGNFVCSQACARVVASSSVLLNLVLTTMRFSAIVLSATLLARADAPRAGASLWGGAVLVSAGVIAFATSPPANNRRPSRKAHVSDPIPEEEA